MIGINLQDPRLGKAFLDMTPKLQMTKNKLDFNKIKIFCATNNAMKEVKTPLENKENFL